MGLTHDLQVCMDTSDWLQGCSPGGVNDLEMGMDSSASSGDIMTCTSRQQPMLETTRLRPQNDQALKCPRCDSTHTKFCYYNNYSLSQPRYFCKTCRRYWTKGGSLRNIPVGGGCRKNTKRSSTSSSTTGVVKKSSPSTSTSTDLHLSTTFPHEVLQMPHFCTTLLGDHHNDIGGINFMESKFDGILGNPIIDPMRTQTDFMASTDLGIVGGLGGHHGFTFSSTTANHIPHHHSSSTMCTPYGINSLSGNINYSSSSTVGNIVDSCQRFVVPFEATHEDPNESTINEMKPNKQILSLDWQDQQQGCSEIGKDPFGYFSNLGSWNPNGVMSTGFGSSATNSLV
ncbi:hypothetical protein Scep_017806 [Stephania cephalantha]|uniref:Dof zinc finger protein n=1 Tax=Stephania cephalantha TaxID=152367 RepID=A0AAP0IQ70_9MAGN